MAIPQEKRDAIAAAAAPGGTGDIYAGLNQEEKSILNEFLAAGHPLEILGRHFSRLTPLIDPIDIRLGDPTGSARARGSRPRERSECFGSS